LSKGLQYTYAPHNECFGCGPANPKGLRLCSIPQGNIVIADWKPEPYHQAFPGILNGGIIGALLDCHSNWSAAYHLMQRLLLTTPPCTVTASYTVKLLRPTPSEDWVHLESEIKSATDKQVIVTATLSSKGKLCATCEGTFVAVGEGHPAYHRW
jgi:acyl-coenzyme A thioesterase PaaI-like protein